MSEPLAAGDAVYALLSDGTTVQIRQPRPDDFDAGRRDDVADAEAPRMVDLARGRRSRFRRCGGALPPSPKNRPGGLSPQFGSGKPNGGVLGSLPPMRRQQRAWMRRYATCSPGMPRPVTVAIASLRIVFRMTVGRCSHSRSLRGSWLG
jgi:hypothetical protein